MDVVNGILDLSKIEVGALELYTNPVVLAELADSRRRLISPLAEAAQVRLD